MRGALRSVSSPALAPPPPPPEYSKPSYACEEPSEISWKDALKHWKLNIFEIIDRRTSFYSQNTNMLPRKPKISYRYLKSGIEEFHRKYVLVPADKAANNVVVV